MSGLRVGMRGIVFAVAVVLGPASILSSSAGADEYGDTMLKGKEAFASQCLNCHQSIDEVTGAYRTRPDWQKIVAGMAGRGAKLDETQQAAVVEYLAGRMLLIGKCRGCHTYLRPLTVGKSLANWRSTIQRMAERMPKDLGMTPEQIDQLAVFLAIERPAR